MKNLADDKPLIISKDTLEKMKDGKLYKLIVASIERNEIPVIDEDPEYLRHAIQYLRHNRQVSALPSNRDTREQVLNLIRHLGLDFGLNQAESLSHPLAAQLDQELA